MPMMPETADVFLEADGTENRCYDRFNGGKDGGLTGLYLLQTLGIENKGEEAGKKRHGDHPGNGRGAKRYRLANQLPVAQKAQPTEQVR